MKKGLRAYDVFSCVRLTVALRRDESLCGFSDMIVGVFMSLAAVSKVVVVIIGILAAVSELNVHDFELLAAVLVISAFHRPSFFDGSSKQKTPFGFFRVRSAGDPCVKTHMF